MRKLALVSMLSVATALLLGSAALSVRADDAAATGSISGKVVDKDGKAVAKATVSAMPAERPTDGSRPKAAATATTDDNGAFKLDKLPAASYRVMAVSEDKTQRGRASAAVDVKAGAETKLDKDITIQAGGGRRGGGGGGGGAGN